MNLLLKQKSKDLFKAEFEILENDIVVGNIFLQGKLGSMEVELNLIIYNQNLSLKYSTDKTDKIIKKFRPYSILQDNNIIGEMFQTEFRKNIFSKYDFNRCIYNNKEYNLYSIGLGKKSASVLYSDNTQLAQIEKEGIVYNDLHNYNIYSIDKESASISVLMSIYMYISTCYKPGIKVKESVVKNYSKTTNKELLNKYNPEWIKSIGGK